MDRSEADIARELRTFAAALVRAGRAAVDGGGLVAPKTERDRRLALCLECNSYEPSLGKANFGRCRECGCLAAAKVSLVSEACPRGRWSALNNGHEHGQDEPGP